jgi:hypothetical protein
MSTLARSAGREYHTHMRTLGHLGGYFTGELGALDPLTETALTSVAQMATSDPAVIQDRARAAALADVGYQYLDEYEQMQPMLFFLSCAGLVASGYALWKRPHKPEPITLYSITALLSAVGAYMTRPAALRAAPTPAAAATASTPAMAGVLSWLDNRVKARTAAQPGWEAQTWNRLAGDTGHAPLDPAVAALFTANSH